MRKNSLSHPRFQILFTLSFVVGAVFVVASLMLATWATLIHIARNFPLSDFQRAILRDGASQLILYMIPAIILTSIGFAIAGFILSGKFIGPLTRLERWIENHLRGETDKPLRLRKGDELNAIVTLLHKVLEREKGKL